MREGPALLGLEGRQDGGLAQLKREQLPRLAGVSMLRLWWELHIEPYRLGRALWTADVEAEMRRREAIALYNSGKVPNYALTDLGFLVGMQEAGIDVELGWHVATRFALEERQPLAYSVFYNSALGWSRNNREDWSEYVRTTQCARVAHYVLGNVKQGEACLARLDKESVKRFNSRLSGARPASSWTWAQLFMTVFFMFVPVGWAIAGAAAIVGFSLLRHRSFSRSSWGFGFCVAVAPSACELVVKGLLFRSVPLLPVLFAWIASLITSLPQACSRFLLACWEGGVP